MSSAPYIPTSYTAPIQDDGDTTFWGSLIQPGLGHAPSDIFPRFTDALFFYLDENVEPKKSGYIEPSKVVFWIKATRGNTVCSHNLSSIIEGGSDEAPCVVESQS